MRIDENVPLAPLTTFKIGGPARWFAEAQSEDDIVETTTWVKERGLPLFVLGGGSNLLVSDKGFPGLVLRIALTGVEAEEPSSLPEKETDLKPTRIYRVGAGQNWDDFVQRALDDGSAGVECLAGIPGTVGGTPVQNVGAYGQEVATTIECVRAYDLASREFVEFAARNCGFGYRRSRFNSEDRGRFIVTRVDFKLEPGGQPAIAYPDVAKAVAESTQAGAQPSLSQVAAKVREIRRSKGMLLVDGDFDSRSAGSFFKNPIINLQQLEQVKKITSFLPRTFDVGVSGDGKLVKIPAAWLIEQAGFGKGFQLGAAGISSRHTLALINRGGAKSADVLKLAEEIRSAVAARFGVELEMEPVMVGEPT